MAAGLDAFGATRDSPHAKRERVSVSGQPFGNAWRVAVLEKPERPPHVQLRAVLPKAVKKTDALYVTFWLRAVGPGEAAVELLFEQSGPPYLKSAVLPVKAGKDWKRVELAFNPKADYAAGDSQVALRLGYGKQVVEVGGFTVLNFGDRVSFRRLPAPQLGREAEEAAARAKPSVLPPQDLGRIAEIAGWMREVEAKSGSPVFYTPPFSNRVFWDEIARQRPARELFEAAERESALPVPELTEALFDEFRKSGQRDSYEKPFAARTERLGYFLFAEGWANDGRYLPALERELAAILEEPTWCAPAHAINRKDWNDARDFVDLAAAARAWNLATVDFLLGPRLAPATRARIRHEVRERVFASYLERIRKGNRLGFWWMGATNNWVAVCHAGVLGAALLLEEDAAARAEFAAAFEACTPTFIAGFGEDGFCHEGIGYWTYGYGHYTMAAELLRLNTGDHVDLLAGGKQRLIGTLDVRWRVAPGVYPYFGDVGRQAGAPSWLHDFATLRYRDRGGITGPVMTGMMVSQHGLGAHLYVTSFDVALPRPASGSAEAAALRAEQPGLRGWFPDGGALVVRRSAALKSAGLSAAFKGGHNGQPHNHNDLGSFMVVCDGDVVVNELGSDVYVRDTFGPKRYTSGLMNSLGHPVPRVAGRLQLTGKEARAVTVRTEFAADDNGRDVWVIDLTSAYEVAKLERLTRTFIFERAEGGRLEIVDRVKFRDGAEAQAFESALILRHSQRTEHLGKEGVRVWGERAAVDVTWSAGDRKLVALEEPVHGIVPDQPAIGRRLGIAFSEPVIEGEIRMIFVPAM
ncbi:heparinase II/III family protein [Geminisphaera colitermitum]|uniref:heparinase II/III family protein n=1 Tax=Geminisphaera colitermitum TaxID=1148786 RepID=UPI001E3E627A|nr:heparinase II/III family protein [Geminisphaera colitermitum]